MDATTKTTYGDVMSDKEKIDQARDLIIQHGGHDGEHHKEWCLDQVFRILVGDQYKSIVKKFRKNGYDWKEGIAP